MNKLKLELKFLDIPKFGNQAPKFLDPIEEILDTIGSEIANYAKGYLNYIVTTSSNANFMPAQMDVVDSSLYIVVPELGYDYKIFSISYNFNKTEATLFFFTLTTNQTEHTTFDTGVEDWKIALENKIIEILNNGLANATFEFIIDRILLKREASSQINPD